MNVIHIAFRELRAIFNTVVGWLILCGFLLITGVFWIALVENYVRESNNLVFNPWGAANMSLTDYLLLPFFGNCTVVLLMVAPALSMRLFSAEVKQRTLELLLTSPVSTLEIVLGKYLGAVGFVAVLLATTLHLPISLLYWAEPEPGVLIGGYLALLILSAALIAMGMMYSAMTSSQTVALVLCFATALALYIISWMGEGPDHWATHLSLATHAEDLMKGKLRLSDICYYAGFISFFLFFTHQRVESHRWL
ncbi:MAG: ABC transporter permease subunit [Proteobacteria bacterium]|nr:ABC transporter permease subunit [Pseudomonadota bacterium]